jgi:hypothetical protein
MRHDQQVLLMEGKLRRCAQIRHYSDELFGAVKA